jgi:hypothetical protein
MAEVPDEILCGNLLFDGIGSLTAANARHWLLTMKQHLSAEHKELTGKLKTPQSVTERRLELQRAFIAIVGSEGAARGSSWHVNGDGGDAVRTITLTAGAGTQPEPAGGYLAALAYLPTLTLQ